MYISGYSCSAGQTATGTYWKNDVAVSVPNTGAIYGITVSGGDVYLSGNNSNGQAIFWKNGVIDILGKGGATGIAVAQ